MPSVNIFELTKSKDDVLIPFERLISSQSKCWCLLLSDEADRALRGERLQRVLEKATTPMAIVARCSKGKGGYPWKVLVRVDEIDGVGVFEPKFEVCYSTLDRIEAIRTAKSLMRKR